jgi:ankyrin repeat protein
LLLAYGADPLRATSDGTTPVELARRSGHAECASLLEGAAAGTPA